MPINTGALKARMSACGITAKELADALGIDESTYYRRMANKGDTFTVAEAQQIAATLCMTKREATDVFLP